ncbi:hypothetical protein L2E82_51354 [Cichorium intybus]|nr:hypothetical protein L2E82_51354 [Cichorium intybus]
MIINNRIFHKVRLLQTKHMDAFKDSIIDIKTKIEKVVFSPADGYSKTLRSPPSPYSSPPSFSLQITLFPP